MKKKYSLLIAAILIVILVFNACSDKGASGNPSEKSDATVTESGKDMDSDGETSTTKPDGDGGQTKVDDTGASSKAGSDSASIESTEESTGETQEQPGIMSSFNTTDVDGNAVDPSIFADTKLTMVNVWATYCGPCLKEMPDLGELAAEYKDKGVRIVGLVSDTLDQKGNIDESQVEAAKEIISDTGADYLHILPSADLFGLLSQISAVPTTFFVDSEGRQVGSAYSGSREKDVWAKLIDEALAEVE